MFVFSRLLHFSRSKIASHPGFEEWLCYGDIVLAFEHLSQPITSKERQHIQKVREENELLLEKQLQDQPVYASKRYSLFALNVSAFE